MLHDLVMRQSVDIERKAVCIETELVSSVRIDDRYARADSPKCHYSDPIDREGQSHPLRDTVLVSEEGKVEHPRQNEGYDRRSSGTNEAQDCKGRLSATRSTDTVHQRTDPSPARQ